MWLLVMSIAFIFVVQFGPQARGCRNRVSTPPFMAKVYGSLITEEAFRWAWIISRSSSVSREQSKAMRLKESVLNGLIERELLAISAEKIGLKVTNDEVDDNILAGRIYYNAPIHSPLRIPSGPIPIDFTRDDGSFDYDTFKMFVTGQFQMTIDGFRYQQTREILADKMRNIILNSVWLYPDEARQKYYKTSNWLKVEVATFDPSIFAENYSTSDVELNNWMKNNSQKVENYYKENEFLYSNIEKQVKISNILIRVSEDMDESEKENKRKLADEIARRAISGENFSNLAKQFSDDEKTKNKGGENPYSPKGTFDEKVEDVAFGMKPGEIKGPIETEEGYEIIKCEGFREGKVPFEEVKTEIAKKLFTEETGKNEAKLVAQKFLELVTGGLNFEEAKSKLNEIYGANQETTTAKPPSKSEAFALLIPLPKEVPSIKTSGEIHEGSTYITGIGVSKDLVEELFKTDDTVKIIPRVVEINNKFYIIRKSERHYGSDAEFLKQKDAIERELIGEKRIAVLEEWINAARKKAEKEGAIKIEKRYFPDEKESQKESSEDMGD